MNVTKRIGLSLGGVATSLGLLVSGLAGASAPAGAASPADGPAKQSTTTDERSTDPLRCRVPNCYGAITLAYGDTKVGLSNHSASKRAAYRTAAAHCRRQSSFPCRRITWTVDACAAIAVKTSGRRVDKYGYARGYNRANPAVRAAKRKCKQVRPVGRPCLKTAYICTPRRF